MSDEVYARLLKLHCHHLCEPVPRVQAFCDDRRVDDLLVPYASAWAAVHVQANSVTSHDAPESNGSVDSVDTVRDGKVRPDVQTSDLWLDQLHRDAGQCTICLDGWEAETADQYGHAAQAVCLTSCEAPLQHVFHRDCALRMLRSEECRFCALCKRSAQPVTGGEWSPRTDTQPTQVRELKHASNWPVLSAATEAIGWTAAPETGDNAVGCLLGRLPCPAGTVRGFAHSAARTNDTYVLLPNHAEGRDVWQKLVALHKARLTYRLTPSPLPSTDHQAIRQHVEPNLQWPRPADGQPPRGSPMLLLQRYRILLEQIKSLPV